MAKNAFSMRFQQFVADANKEITSSMIALNDYIGCGLGSRAWFNRKKLDF